MAPTSPKCKHIKISFICKAAPNRYLERKRHFQTNKKQTNWSLKVQTSRHTSPLWVLINNLQKSYRRAVPSLLPLLMAMPNAESPLRFIIVMSAPRSSNSLVQCGWSPYAAYISAVLPTYKEKTMEINCLNSSLTRWIVVSNKGK